MKRDVRIACFGFAIALWSAAACAGSAELSVVDPWIPETPPGATVAAAYFELVNDGDATGTVVGATSPACERIEFHRMELDGDVARMRPQDSLAVAPGEKLALSPDGTHLMLIRPKVLAAGDRVLIRLALADGGEISIEAVVRVPGHGAHDHHAH